MTSSFCFAKFIYLFNKCLYSIAYVLGSVLGTWDIPVSKTEKDPCPCEATWEYVKFFSGVQRNAGAQRRKDRLLCMCVSRALGKASREKRHLLEF